MMSIITSNYGLLLGCFADKSCELSIVAKHLKTVALQGEKVIRWTIAIADPRECQRHVVVRFRRNGDQNVPFKSDFVQMVLRYQTDTNQLHACSEIEHDLTVHAGQCLLHGPFKSE